MWYPKTTTDCSNDINTLVFSILFNGRRKTLKKQKKGKRKNPKKRKENFFAKTSKPEDLPHSKLKMEHLDLAGYMNTPVNWNLGAFEQQGE